MTSPIFFKASAQAPSRSNRSAILTPSGKSARSGWVKRGDSTPRSANARRIRRPAPAVGIHTSTRLKSKPAPWCKNSATWEANGSVFGKKNVWGIWKIDREFFRFIQLQSADFYYFSFIVFFFIVIPDICLMRCKSLKFCRNRRDRE